MSRTLIVRHLPVELDGDDQTDLLKKFGATHVRSMGHKGRMKHVAFATFPDVESASAALKRLHQLEILKRRLVVEFSTSTEDRKYHPTELPEVKLNALESQEKDKTKDKNKTLKEKPEDQRNKVAEEINSLNEKFGLQYPLNPRLQYVYPAPTVTILTNIANALASVPKFYVQVLHLMNKMNLPAPFGPVTMTPPLAAEQGAARERTEIQEPDVVEETQMDISSEEESELESDAEDNDAKSKAERPVVTKRVKKHVHKPRKRAKLQLSLVSTTKPKAMVQKVEEVFEVPLIGGGNRRTEFKLTPSIGRPTREERELSPGPGQGEAAQSESSSIPAWDVPTGPDLLSITEPELPSVESGFGKIEPVAKAAVDEEENEEEEEWGATEFISSRKLRRNRLSHREMREYSAFRNYQEGEPTSRLYIKNVAKQVTEKDLHYLYGKYVNWEDEAQKLLFDIRLMKEGRMKGQAFVTLPDDKRAQEALRDTHGFMMKGKPIVVQFARSAKPKEKDEKNEKGKKGNPVL